MKAQRIIYWASTIVFAGFMIFSGIPNILLTPENVTFITDLGYPEYFIPFIGVAKVAGSIAILIPALGRMREWAYAGLFFDLIAAVYSLIAVYGVDPSMIFMVIIIGVGTVSYFGYRKSLL